MQDPSKEQVRFAFDKPLNYNITLALPEGSRADEAENARAQDERFQNLGWYHEVKHEWNNSATLRLIQDRLNDERREAYLRLAVCDSNNANRVRELQNAVWRADMFEKWIKAFLLDQQTKAETLQREIGDPPPTD